MSQMDLEEIVKDLPTEPGDHDKFSHYFRNVELTDAYVFGNPIKALCGFVMVPTRDHTKFPVCPECKEIWEAKEPD